MDEEADGQVYQDADDETRYYAEGSLEGREVLDVLEAWLR